MDRPDELDAGRSAGAPAPSAPEDDMTAGTFDVEEYRGLLRSAEARLDAVDQALVRLDEGTYGTCATCGEPIGDDRLDGDPTARRCARHDEADPGASGAWAAPPAGG